MACYSHEKHEFNYRAWFRIPTTSTNENGWFRKNSMILWSFSSCIKIHPRPLAFDRFSMFHLQQALSLPTQMCLPPTP